MSQPSSRAGVPEHIGRFELLVPIGTGGMATVYLSRTRLVADTYRLSALKILHQKLGADDGAGLADLVAEAKLASAIRHPNVVPVLSVEEDQPWVALVMEYVEGETISGLARAARTKGEKIPPPVIGAMLGDVLAGLHAAHEATDEGRPLNLVHRDVSPQNVIVGVDGRARLTDFGIAKIDRTNATATGLVKGKTGYMAPEQIAGHKLDRAVDIWAAGVVAWELLAGERLFQGDPMPTMLRIVQEIPPRVRTVNPEVPTALDELVATALLHDPKQRPPTADAFRRALLDAWSGFGGVAEPAEVDRYVESLAAEKLERRRAQVTEMVELRSRMSSVTRNAEASARETSSVKDLPTRSSASPAASSASAADVGTDTPRPKRRAPLAVFAAIGVAVGVGGWLAWRSGAAPSTRVSSESSATSHSGQPSAAGPQASVPQRVVVFSSKKAMKAVRSGGREVATPPTLSLGVPIADGQQEAVVVADDGETVVIAVAANATQVDVPFAAPATTASASSVVTPARSAVKAPVRSPSGSATSKPVAKDPGLADTPYRR